VVSFRYIVASKIILFEYDMSMSNIRENYELWWSRNLGKQSYLHDGAEVVAPSLENFGSWMGDSQSRDRVIARSHFDSEGSFLDVGCGAAPEYEGLKLSKPDVVYTGVDITPELVAFNKSRGISCFQGSANSLPFEDNSFDVVHCRHVVEHMSNVELALSEFIRVARNKVFIVFFIGPSYFKSSFNLDNKGTDGEVFHNTYSRRDIKNLLKRNEKVQKFKFIKIPKPSTQMLIVDLF
jgi:ubiquinone/menaquinone biosynthesis C-methylase UbiE